mmetsp:Transcript_46400/g.100042  ORF Transcript_46400/g.100042 Transcript_46400/m.100042 type:complete len:538 (-) Transcript_46400:33-1646(-)
MGCASSSSLPLPKTPGPYASSRSYEVECRNTGANVKGDIGVKGVAEMEGQHVAILRDWRGGDHTFLGPLKLILTKHGDETMLQTHAEVVTGFLFDGDERFFRLSAAHYARLRAFISKNRIRSKVPRGDQKKLIWDRISIDASPVSLDGSEGKLFREGDVLELVPSADKSRRFFCRSSAKVVFLRPHSDKTLCEVLVPRCGEQALPWGELNFWATKEEAAKINFDIEKQDDCLSWFRDEDGHQVSDCYPVPTDWKKFKTRLVKEAFRSRALLQDPFAAKEAAAKRSQRRKQRTSSKTSSSSSSSTSSTDSKRSPSYVKPHPEAWNIAEFLDSNGAACQGMEAIWKAAAVGDVTLRLNPLAYEALHKKPEVEIMLSGKPVEYSLEPGSYRVSDLRLALVRPMGHTPLAAPAFDLVDSSGRLLEDRELLSDIVASGGGALKLVLNQDKINELESPEKLAVAIAHKAAEKCGYGIFYRASLDPAKHQVRLMYNYCRRDHGDRREGFVFPEQYDYHIYDLEKKKFVDHGHVGPARGDAGAVA